MIGIDLQEVTVTGEDIFTYVGDFRVEGLLE
jgi:hypothetical protein